MGIFGIFQQEDREFVTFRTGILGGPGRNGVFKFVSILIIVKFWQLPSSSNYNV